MKADPQKLEKHSLALICPYYLKYSYLDYTSWMIGFQLLTEVHHEMGVCVSEWECHALV